MDRDFSNFNNSGGKRQKERGYIQDIDASGVLLNTLTAFEEIDKLENLAVNDEVVEESIESFLPSLENIMEFSSYLRDKIEFILNMNGLANDPAFVIDTSKSGKKVSLSGDRKDLRKVSRLINSDSETRDGLLTLLSIAGQTYELLQSLDKEEKPAFNESARITYLYGDGYLSLYKEG